MDAESVVGAGRPADAPLLAALATPCVQERCTRRGVGAALLAQALEHAQQPLWLTVNAQNRRAIAFCAAQGGSKIGRAQFVLGGESPPNHVPVMSDPRDTARLKG